jgi:anti-sigma B factor antagonist
MTAVGNQARIAGIQVKTLGSDDAVRLAVRGELDVATAGPFALAGQEALTGRSQTTLAIDMGQVTFIDAAGVGALVAIRDHAQLNDNVVVVTEPSRCVARLLDLTALAAIFVSNRPSGTEA